MYGFPAFPPSLYDQNLARLSGVCICLSLGLNWLRREELPWFQADLSTSHCITKIPSISHTRVPNTELAARIQRAKTL
jgi:hypothetical protein